MTEPKRDHYEVLGVSETADAEEIRLAFVRLSSELQSDIATDPAAEQRLREVSEAYNVLSRPRARFLYDNYGYSARSEGHGDAAPRPPRVLGHVVVEGVEAERGSRREVEIASEDVCEACAGSGAAPGSSMHACGTCGGKGTVRAASGLGRWLRVEPCPDCEGEGRFQTPCPECGGSGEVRREQTLTVRIPAGVDDGARVTADEDENAHLLVRVEPGPRDSLSVRLLALALLAAALGLLAYFVFWI